VTKGEETRQRIIATAAPIFNMQGFAGASMQDILDATGLEKGGLYRHFASKEDLAAEAFQYAIAEVIRVRSSGMDSVENSVARLRYLVNRFLTVASPIPGGCPIMNVAVEADDGNPKLRALVRKGVRTWKAGIVKIVRDGLRKGEIRKGTNPTRMANTMIGLLEGALMISRLEGSRDAVRDAQITLDGILDAVEI
jgi:TetR/AcrR family transcriptional regulator, transcriptional repressor for nem operon